MMERIKHNVGVLYGEPLKLPLGISHSFWIGEKGYILYQSRQGYADRGFV